MLIAVFINKFLVTLIITSAYGSRHVLVSRASRSNLGRAGSGQLRSPLNINALRVNLVNIDIVDFRHSYVPSARPATRVSQSAHHHRRRGCGCPRRLEALPVSPVGDRSSCAGDDDAVAARFAVVDSSPMTVTRHSGAPTRRPCTRPPAGV